MTSMLPGVCRIGTSNIVLPQTKKDFPVAYRQRSRLHYYASLFNTLEVNSSFYKIPLPATFEKWTVDVPGDFHFTIKLWRGITHARNLSFHEDYVDAFMRAANCIGSKKGCLLVQLPASITIRYLPEVEKILKQLRALDPAKTWRLSFEFRHNSWYTREVYALLDSYCACIVLHDMPAAKNYTLNNAGFVYLRFHGVAGDYKGSYHTDVLYEHAQNIKQWLHQGKDVYVYFNNTIGDAFNNAQELGHLIHH